MQNGKRRKNGRSLGAERVAGEEVDGMAEDLVEGGVEVKEIRGVKEAAVIIDRHPEEMSKRPDFVRKGMIYPQIDMKRHRYERMIKMCLWILRHEIYLALALLRAQGLSITSSSETLSAVVAGFVYTKEAEHYQEMLQPPDIAARPR